MYKIVNVIKLLEKCLKGFWGNIFVIIIFTFIIIIETYSTSRLSVLTQISHNIRSSACGYSQLRVLQLAGYLISNYVL